MTTTLTSTATRRAWIVGGSVLAAAVLLIGTVQVISAMARDTETVVRTFPAGDVALVDVRNPNGRVEVLGGDVPEITMTAEITHGLRRTRHSAAVEGNVLRMRSSCPVIGTWCRVEHRLVVPRRMSVAVDVENGRLILRDLTGGIRADADNGEIELTRLSGDLEVSTDNGRVESSGLTSDRVDARTQNGRVRLAFTEPPTSVEARSRNGRVDVVVPQTQDAYRVDLDTTNGSTDVGVRSDPTSRRSIVGRTQNGDVTVRYPAG